MLRPLRVKKNRCDNHYLMLLSQLHVAISYPREFVRAAIEEVNRGVARYTAGLFRSRQGVEEVGTDL